ncbi:hypothetical protein PUN4_550027 [Paraburkholderia unamae]|nr:hypothetical protein PUN4_550027 [Paraburkholderia unamae]
MPKTGYHANPIPNAHVIGNANANLGPLATCWLVIQVLLYFNGEGGRAIRATKLDRLLRAKLPRKLAV